MSSPFISYTGTSSPALAGSRRSSVYALFAVAMVLTLVGIGAGVTFAQPIIASGWAFLLLIFQFALVLTARMRIGRTSCVFQPVRDTAKSDKGASIKSLEG